MKKILIIEDNLDVRENINELLSLSGYEVYIAENGKIGTQQAIKNKPDLIICDIMMPILDGYSTLKVLRRNPKTIHIPFIFLTAKTKKDDFRKGMNMGADDYISKPFTDIELLEAIETRLEKSQNTIPKILVNSFLDDKEHFEKVFTDFLIDKEYRFYNKKDIIFKTDNYCRFVFWIKKGKAMTYKTNEFGKKLILSLLRTNDLIGIDDVFYTTNYKHSAIATENSEIALIPKDDFIEFLKTDNCASQYITRVLAQKSAKKDIRLLKMAYSCVRKRLAEALLLIYNHYNKKSDNYYEINISREELAFISGATKETVTRTLSEFKACNLIETKGSKITLLDIDELIATPD
jgi:CRP/FNR family transcriptional regulator, polysaccharide utilization system transcription regulator